MIKNIPQYSAGKPDRQVPAKKVYLHLKAVNTGSCYVNCYVIYTNQATATIVRLNFTMKYYV